MTTAPIGILVLAAGGSLRLGRPKQLLPWCGHTLIHRAVKAALDAQMGPVAVVLGAAAEECRHAIAGLDAQVVVNPEWSKGMGSSISIGVAAMTAQTQLHAVIIMLCDQPAVSAEALRSLAAEQETSHADIVAARYDGTLGPPARFLNSCFPRLRALPASSGAKALFDEPGIVVMPWPFPAGSQDIDTPEDWEAINATGRT